MGKNATVEVSHAERAVLVFVNPNAEDDEYVEEELRELSRTAGLNLVGEFRQRRSRPSASTYLGSGKTEELYAFVQDAEAEVTVIDDELTPIQQRNLEKLLTNKVIDRPQLILDIFAQRAHTSEGILQVELAQLTYMLPRITSVYTRFERQQGGIGVRGPGETKLEADRRVLRDRISVLKEQLEHVRTQRAHQRASRRKYPYPFGAIVGYTSAGKSTLLNALAGSDVYADAKLFATLDPTTRRVDLPEGYSAFFTDTVGFIRELPTTLIAAFRATLEEVVEADFLIHVVDVSNPQWELQRDTVLETLRQLGAGAKPIITVLNKADLITDQYSLRELVARYPKSVYVSARLQQGMNYLFDLVIETARSLLVQVNVVIPYADSDIVSKCYEYGRIESVEYLEEGIALRAEVVEEMAGRLLQYPARA